jgi:hypothetical protein
MLAALLAVMAAVGAVAQLAGQDRPDRRGIEMSLGVGVGSLGTSCDSCRGGGAARQSGAAVHVWVGAPVGPDLLLGLDIVHWSTPQRDTGVALSVFTVSADYYPLTRSRWFVSGGLGVSSYAITPSLPSIGLGLSIGTGFDIRVARNFSLTPLGQLLWGTPRDVKDNEQLVFARGLKPGLVLIDLNASFHFRQR